MLDDTGERYLPWWQEAVISYEHLHRYAYATQFVTGKKVLDLACGEGYGSYLLSTTADSVVAIDIDDQAIKHAASKYLRTNLRFEIGSITDVPICGQDLFQVITCFEAIEHIDDHNKFLREVKRLLTTDGIFIVSTPNKRVYSDEPKYRNPFHVRELYFQEFKALLEAQFKQVRFLGQRVYSGSTVWPLFCRHNPQLAEYVIDKNSEEYVFVEKDKRDPMYFIAIATNYDQQLDENASVLIDLSNNLIKQRETEIIALTHARDALEATVRAQQHALVVKDTQVSHLEADIASLKQQLQLFRMKVQEKEQECAARMAEELRLADCVKELEQKIQNQERAYSDAEQKIAWLQGVARDRDRALEQLTLATKVLEESIQSQGASLSHKEQQINELRITLSERDQALGEIEASLAWNLITRYQQLRGKLCPDGTLRARCYHHLKKFVKVSVQEGLRSACSKTLKKIRGSASLALTTKSPSHFEETGAVHVEQGSGLKPYLSPDDPYDAWLRVNAWNDKVEAHLRERLTQHSDQLPLISVVMPFVEPQIDRLRNTINSVKGQIYRNWELCVAVGATAGEITRAMWEEDTVADSRIKVAVLSHESNMAHVINAAAELAEGEFMVFLEPSDELAPNALAEIALYLAERPSTDFLYSDEDSVDDLGRRSDPQFKPCWSPELLLSYMYCGHLTVVRRRLFEQVGGLREGYDGAEQYDFVLRATERARQVGHLPLVLYHRRFCLSKGVASEGQDPYGAVSGQRAVQEAIRRRTNRSIACRSRWTIEDGVTVYGHEFPDDGPSVAILLLGIGDHAAIARCLESIRSTTYKNYRVVIVVDESKAPPDIKNVLSVPYQVMAPASFAESRGVASLLNHAVEQVDADYILFLDTNVEVRERHWLSRMVAYAQLSGVGVVGSGFCFADGRRQYSEDTDGLAPAMARPAQTLSPTTECNLSTSATVTINCSAVSRICMLTSRGLFLTVGGFDEERFGAVYYGTDYCYRLVESGYRCVSCEGTGLLYHKRDDPRCVPDAKETIVFRERYRYRKDPCCNPNLSLSEGKFSIWPRKVLTCTVRPIRALMCSHNLAWEGAPQSQYELTVALKSRGVLDPVVYSPEDGPLKSMYRSHGIEVVVQSHPLLGVFKLSEWNDAIKKFGDFCQRLNAEIIYANTLQTFYAIITAERIGLPSLWNPRESEPWETYFDFLPRDIRNTAFECFRYPYRIVFVSEATRSAWQQLNVSHNFAVIRNGLDVQSFRARCGNWTRESARQYLRVQDHETAILLLGTVCPRKGQQDLLLALRKVPFDLARQLKCYIVGDRPGQYSDELKQLLSDLKPTIREQVCVVPETYDVGLYYRAADIFLCTSRVESYPRVILEAMASGLPIITTNVFGIKEQVVEGFNALLYDPGDTERLAEAIASLTSNRQARALFAKNSMDQLSSLTTFDEMVNGYGELFREAYLSKGYPKRKGACTAS